MSTSTGTQPLTDAAGRGRRLDLGRVAMVPLSIGLGAVSLHEAVGLLGDRGGSLTLLSAATTGMTAVFYALVVAAYLRRGPARATSTVSAALAAAPAATFLPFLLPFVAAGDAPLTVRVAGSLVLLAGLLFSVWSLRCLDRSLSMVPQARVLVTHGPYALVRHPLYLGELVAMLGLALTLGGLWPVLLWVVLIALQCYRAVQEEALLTTALPGYEQYRQRTARVLPGLF